MTNWIVHKNRKNKSRDRENARDNENKIKEEVLDNGDVKERKKEKRLDLLYKVTS